MMGPDKDPGVNRRAIAHLLSLVEKEREVRVKRMYELF